MRIHTGTVAVSMAIERAFFVDWEDVGELFLFPFQGLVSRHSIAVPGQFSFSGPAFARHFLGTGPRFSAVHHEQ
ncbi:MAG TPA: hypothetical protein VHS96_08915 [Bacteroidia bacterium]|nr:hypothetical protein [Bacteroidia bacterium]